MGTYVIQWKKLVTEGIVIVVSILLAFAIDAWWEDRQELKAAEDQVSRVLAELRANVGILENQNEYLSFATDGVKEFLARFGPEPQPSYSSPTHIPAARASRSIRSWSTRLPASWSRRQ